MSNERLRELGIPRRNFLKRTATAAFVAPVVVSFGLDGIAEAQGQSYANQCFSNQRFPNQLVDEADLKAMLDAIVQTLNAGKISFKAAQSLSEKVVLALLQVASKQYSGACNTLQALVPEIQDQGGVLPSSVLSDAQRVQRNLGCVCTPTGANN